MESIYDIEGRNPIHATSTIVLGDSTDLNSSPQNERLSSAIVGAFAEHDEHEGSNDEDDEWNPKHIRQIVYSPSFSQGEYVRSICNKRARPISNDQSVPSLREELLHVFT